MSSKSITTCDGCLKDLQVEHSFQAPFSITVKKKAVIEDVTKHACSVACLAAVLNPAEWSMFIPRAVASDVKPTVQASPFPYR